MTQKMRVELKDESTYDDNVSEDLYETEGNKGQGWIAFIAVLNDEDWDVLEFAGEGQSLLEWYETGCVDDILQIGYSLWNEHDGFIDAISDEPLINGMMAMCKARVVYEVIESLDGREYDLHWEWDMRVLTYPPGSREKNALDWCERVARAGGFCESCRYRMIGATYYARKHKLCDDCAGKEFTHEYKKNADPLYPLRLEVKAALYRAYPGASFESTRASCWKVIDKAASEQELLKMLKEYNEEAKRGEALDYLYR